MTTCWSPRSNPICIACKRASASAANAAPSKFILVILWSGGFQHSLSLFYPSMLFCTNDYFFINFLINRIVSVADCCMFSCKTLFCPIQITHMAPKMSCFC
ncbi:hypothetical protein E1A91_A07G131700v1 [Gossypium mustelinum]|uniref:Uncharacterized protein n=1 Tax=Gossypium mustelinum TaxID=34275 RepID=A0A5D2YKD3_GOSMU|nr:hypothetical protein E1A91_A07G131700v1 [Gossypium mustelinum]